MAYITLFDKNFKALGSNEQFVATQHVTKSWTLKRRAYEFDDFSVTCRGFRDSKNACFVGLFSDQGKLQYLCFCGIPATDGELTTITGIDCRNIFNQSLPVSLGSQKITSVRTLFEFLLKTALGSIKVGIDYDIEFDDISDETWADPGQYIERTLDVRNIWELIQAANAMFDTIVVTSWKVDEETNSYRLVFSVKNIHDTYKIKLSDYSIRMTRTNNITNIAVATTKDFSQSMIYYLTTDNQVLSATLDEGIDAEKSLFPPKIETFQGETLEEASVEAKQALYDNRFKDRVVIDCNSVLGKRLAPIDLDCFGELVGYNPSDDDSVKKLPVSAIEEDSKGSRKIEFGRLSEYWFLN